MNGTSTSSDSTYLRSLCIGLFGLLLFHTVGGQIADKDFRRMIGADAFTPDEKAAIEKGEVVVRSLDSKEKLEIATIGILRIDGLPPMSMEQFRDSLSQRTSDSRKGGGRFGEPPTEADVADLELDADTIAQLKKCAIGKCDLNLSAEMITRFQREIDWTSPRAEADATRLLKEMIVGYVQGYLERGDDSLGGYDNRRKPIDLAAAHRSLLATSPLISDLAPELIEYMQNFPRGGLENSVSNLHWSIVDFGLKPSITISHAVAYTQVRGGHDQHIVASKQIYSSRYLDSSLTFTALLRVESDKGIDTYLVFLDRSRSDALDGPLGKFARRIVRNEAANRIGSLLDKAHVRLLAMNRPPAQTGDDSGQDYGSWAGAFSDRRVVIAIVGLVFVVAFLFWRRRKRIA
jgi:hypothetical protein